MSLHFSRGTLVCVLVCVLMQTGSERVAAKKPKEPSTPPTAASTSGPKPEISQARVRLWKACDPTGSALQIRFVPTVVKGGVAPVVFPVNTQDLEFTGYIGMPAGAAVVEITLPNHPAVALPVNLLDGSNSTLLVKVRNGEIYAACISDNPVADEAGMIFTAYNLLSGTGGEVVVKLGEVMDIHLATPGGNARTSGLKPAVYPVTVTGIDTEGRTFRWTTETDLKRNRRSTLLIYPDTYGRIRPRVIEDNPVTDGPSKSPASAPKK